MKKIIQQIFLFFIPTLVVALVFISLNQQNAFASTDSDSDGSVAKIESPVKNAHSGILPLHLYDGATAQKISRAVMVAVGDTSLVVLAMRCSDNICNIKNHSPPVPLAI